jgi:hypothetical protein
MGAGDDHIEEMAEGIKHATVVLIFFSDAYLNRYISQNQTNIVAETYHATVVLIFFSGAYLNR